MGISVFSKDNILKAIIIGIFLPNVLMILACISIDVNINRAPINIDYFLPIILLACKNKYLRALGSIAFILAFLVDVLYVILGSIPYHITLPDFFYLVASLFSGPNIFKYYALIVLVLGIVQLALVYFFSKKIKLQPLLVVYVFSVLFSTLCYFSFSLNVMGSQSYYFMKNRKELMTLPADFILHPTEFYNGTSPWFEKLKHNGKLNNKLLLVVNESWGEPKNPEIQQAIMAVLKSKKDKFEFFQEGASLAGNNTSSGELRELCAAKLLSLGSLSAAHKSYGYERCLPNQLVKQGYLTTSIHGLSDVLYDRKHWYPIVGLERIYFGNDIDLPKDSFDNRAIFDPNLVPFISKLFNNNSKVFVYWLTVTTHYDYREEEIKNQRFSCEKFNVDPKTQACRNMRLQAQYFDAVAALVSKPEMAGVEVVVIGDHTPPFHMDAGGKSSNYFVDNEVYWIYFKIKSN